MGYNYTVNIQYILNISLLTANRPCLLYTHFKIGFEIKKNMWNVASQMSKIFWVKDNWQVVSECQPLAVIQILKTTLQRSEITDLFFFLIFSFIFPLQHQVILRLCMLIIFHISFFYFMTQLALSSRQVLYILGPYFFPNINN